ncbi:hypothetical protein TSAR_012462, partial [Trichomalopsis sarcophagae]
KVNSDKLFVQADEDLDGFVSGIEIKDIFFQSGLTQTVSLCDISQNGKLNNEQFALAMWLIKKKLHGVDLPKKLTPEMIPPSFRQKSAQTILVKEEEERSNYLNILPILDDSRKKKGTGTYGEMDLVIDFQFFKHNKGRVVPKEVGLAVLDLDATVHWIIAPTCNSRFSKIGVLRENNWLTLHHHSLDWYNGYVSLKKFYKTA